MSVKVKVFSLSTAETKENLGSELEQQMTVWLAQQGPIELLHVKQSVALSGIPVNETSAVGILVITVFYTEKKEGGHLSYRLKTGEVRD